MKILIPRKVRKGIVAVEAAILLPVLLTLALMAATIFQMMYVRHVMTDALMTANRVYVAGQIDNVEFPEDAALIAADEIAAIVGGTVSFDGIGWSGSADSSLFYTFTVNVDYPATEL